MGYADDALMAILGINEENTDLTIQPGETREEALERIQADIGATLLAIYASKHEAGAKIELQNVTSEGGSIGDWIITVRRKP